MNTENTQTT